MLIWRDKASGLIYTCVSILFSSVRHSQPGQSHWITHSRRHNRLQSLKCASNIKNVFKDPYVLFHISTFLVLHHKSPSTLIFIKLHISPLFTASLLLRLYRSFDVFRRGQIWGSLTISALRNITSRWFPETACLNTERLKSRANRKRLSLFPRNSLTDSTHVMLLENAGEVNTV